MSEESPRDNKEIRVTKMLEQVRAGVRQRQAELAALDERLKGTSAALLKLDQAQLLEEPVCVSHRPYLGTVIVLVRKAVYHLFLKWYLRSLVEQQSTFNQASTMAVQELFERQEILAQEQVRLMRRLEGVCEQRQQTMSDA